MLKALFTPFGAPLREDETAYDRYSERGFIPVVASIPLFFLSLLCLAMAFSTMDVSPEALESMTMGEQASHQAGGIFLFAIPFFGWIWLVEYMRANSREYEKNTEEEAHSY